MNKHHDEDVLWDGRHIFLLYDLQKTQIIRRLHLNNIILKGNNSFSPVCPQILIKFGLRAKRLTHTSTLQHRSIFSYSLGAEVEQH